MSTKPSPREIEELLPWYAAGTLDATETAEVEAALASDADLRQKLALTREEMGEAVLDTEQLGTPSPRALEALFAKIDAEPVRKAGIASHVLDLGGWLAEWLSPRTLGWAAAAAALVVALQAGVITSSLLKSGDNARYNTASQEPELAAGTFVIVAFQPTATADSIAKTMEAAKASIVEGPQPGGLYRLRIGKAGMASADIDKVVAGLKAQASVIRLVLPAS